MWVYNLFVFHMLKYWIRIFLFLSYEKKGGRILGRNSSSVITHQNCDINPLCPHCAIFLCESSLQHTRTLTLNDIVVSDWCVPWFVNLGSYSKNISKFFFQCRDKCTIKQTGGKTMANVSWHLEIFMGGGKTYFGSNKWNSDAKWWGNIMHMGATERMEVIY